MVLNVISDVMEIERYQHKFQDNLIARSVRHAGCFVGYQGGGSKGTVFWFNDLGYWVSFNKLENRYWNAFGVDRPDEKNSLSIACEINFPLAGVNPQIAGAFGKTDSGEIHIVHRSTIGGGRVGIGRELFMQEYTGRWVDLDDIGQVSRVALVSDLGSPSLPDNIENFVKQIHRIKERCVTSGNGVE